MSIFESQNTLQGLSAVSVTNNTEMKDYILKIQIILKQLSDKNNRISPQTAYLISQDLIEKHQLGIDFPFFQKNFLQVLQILFDTLKNPFLEDLLDICPEKIQNLVKNKQKIDNMQQMRLPREDAKAFFNYLLNTYRIVELLPLFGCPILGHEASDREQLTAIVAMIQAICDDYNLETKKIDSQGAFGIMCELKGFSLSLMNKGVHLENICHLFLQTYANDYAMMANRIVHIDFGAFLAGFIYLNKQSPKPLPQTLFGAIFNIMHSHHAYHMPYRLHGILLPNPCLYPLNFVPAVLISPLPEQKNPVQAIKDTHAPVDISTLSTEDAWELPSVFMHKKV